MYTYIYLQGDPPPLFLLHHDVKVRCRGTLEARWAGNKGVVLRKLKHDNYSSEGYYRYLRISLEVIHHHKRNIVRELLWLNESYRTIWLYQLQESSHSSFHIETS